MEKNNFFEGAKFGDTFIRKNGEVAVYVGQRTEYFPREKRYVDVYLFIGKDSNKEYGGIDYCTKYDERFPDECDIFSKYIEPIDEEKLDKLARNCYKFELNYPDKYGSISAYDLVRAFKVGYKVAKEE